MLLRILWLACLVWATYSGPVTKIEEYSNDLTAAVENTEYAIADAESNDFVDFNEDEEDGGGRRRLPKIYEDLENFEVIPAPKSSLLSKRMAGNRDETTTSVTTTSYDDGRKEFMAYISKNIAPELVDVNLSNADDLERIVTSVCKLYDRYVESKMARGGRRNVDDDDSMMSDQPMNDDSGFKKISVPTFDDVPTMRNHLVSSSERPSSEINADDILARENKERRESLNEDNIENRTRDMYLTTFKHRLLASISRPNTSVPVLPNLTIPFPAQTAFNASDSPYTEKIRSFYPTCEIPKNTKDAWKDENFLNLFFNVDYNQNATIATATLRLHRLPKENQTTSFWNSDICPDNTIFEEEKLLRVSIYWYVKSSKKHSKVKRRLCDSKMVSENSPWIELSVKAATRTWTKNGRNMGLAISVEDQDGATLKASRYFKGATCTVGTVGTPTPRPIPTLITDTAKQINDSAGIFALLGVNQTGSFPGDFGLLPKIDVCVLELPGQMPLIQLNKGDCELKNSLSELIGANAFNTHHHIRHQKHFGNVQHHQGRDSNNAPTSSSSSSSSSTSTGGGKDFRSRIVNKTLLIPKDIYEILNNGSINR